MPEPEVSRGGEIFARRAEERGVGKAGKDFTRRLGATEGEMFGNEEGRGFARRARSARRRTG